MAFSLQQIAAPTFEPVSLADMKAHLTIDAAFTADDVLIAGMIAAARQDAEDYLGKCLMPQQWLYCLDRFPSYSFGNRAPSRSSYDPFGNQTAGFDNGSQTITIPQPPLRSVESVQYADVATGQMTVLDPSQYQVDTVSTPGRLLPGFNGGWPATAGVVNAVQVHFTAGMPAIPANVKLAIQLRAAAYYANREEFLAGTVSPAPELFERILGRVGRTSIFGYVEAS